MPRQVQAPPSAPERLWSTPETAEFLGVPATTLYQWQLRGTGPRSYRVGRYRRYRPAEVQRWLEDHASGPSPEVA